MVEDLKNFFEVLVNQKLKNQLNLSNVYDVFMFETQIENPLEIIISVRIANSSSPRILEYEEDDYISPPGTPRKRDEYVEETPRDELCKYISKFKNEKKEAPPYHFQSEHVPIENDFTRILLENIKFRIERYIQDTISIKIYSDHFTVNFKYNV
jgi:hypothetical protein